MELDRKEKIFLEIAESVAKLSKCVSIHVGCILVKEGRIISQGYNGTLSKFINCNEKYKNLSGSLTSAQRKRHHNWSKKFEVHAEDNSLCYAAKEGISVDGCTVYCTHQPCHDCLRRLIQSGIKRIVYRYPYDKARYTKETKKMIKDLSISVVADPDYQPILIPSEVPHEPKGLIS